MTMAICEVCGNDYDKPLEITLSGSGEKRIFDSFECAIHALAPACARCGVRILGHGVEAAGAFYCSASCAHAVGILSVSDRA